MSACLFCRIAARELPGKIVYEDDRCLALQDIHPRAPVHLLVIPRRHIASLNDIAPEDEALFGHLDGGQHALGLVDRFLEFARRD